MYWVAEANGFRRPITPDNISPALECVVQFENGRGKSAYPASDQPVRAVLRSDGVSDKPFFFCLFVCLLFLFFIFRTIKKIPGKLENLLKYLKNLKMLQ